MLEYCFKFLYLVNYRRYIEVWDGGYVNSIIKFVLIVIWVIEY